MDNVKKWVLEVSIQNKKREEEECQEKLYAAQDKETKLEKY